MRRAVTLVFCLRHHRHRLKIQAFFCDKITNAANYMDLVATESIDSTESFDKKEREKV